MTNSNTTDLSGSSCINSSFFTPENIRLLSKVPSCWRALEGAGEQTINGTPLLVRRQYSGKCMLWCHSCISVSQGSGKLSACTNSFFSQPTKSLGTRLEWYQQRLLTVFLHFLQLNWPLLSIVYCITFCYLCNFHALSPSKWLDTLLASLVPRLLCRGREKSVWYTLLALAPSSLGNLHTTRLD